MYKNLLTYTYLYHIIEKKGEKKMSTDPLGRIELLYTVARVINWIMCVLYAILGIVIFAIGGGTEIWVSGQGYVKTGAFWYYGFICLLYAGIGTWIKFLIIDVVFDFIHNVHCLKNNSFASVRELKNINNQINDENNTVDEKQK